MLGLADGHHRSIPTKCSAGLGENCSLFSVGEHRTHSHSRVSIISSVSQQIRPGDPGPSQANAQALSSGRWSTEKGDHRAPRPLSHPQAWQLPPFLSRRTLVIPAHLFTSISPIKESFVRAHPPQSQVSGEQELRVCRWPVPLWSWFFCSGLDR